MENKIKDKPQLLIHIGYHKTGTTFWQERIFSNENVNLIDRILVQKLLLDASPYEYSNEKFEHWLKDQLSDDKLNVISDEELSGNIHSAGNGRSITFEMIERISQIGIAEVTVMICLRNQMKMIDSCYRQYVKKGGSFNFENYVFSEKRGAKRHRFPGFSFAHLKYDDVIRHSFERIGKDKVKIYLYEQFLENKDSVIQDLSEHLNYDLYVEANNREQLVNRSLSNFTIRLARITNCLFSSDPICRNSLLSLNRLKPVLNYLYSFIDKKFAGIVHNKSYVHAQMMEQINHYFDESNQQTQMLTGLSLADYQYPFKEPHSRLSK